MIYFMQLEINGDRGPVKIGFTRNIKTRLSGVQMSSPFLVLLLGVMDGTKERESEVLKAFREYRIRGEWFSPADALMSYIAANAAMPTGQNSDESSLQFLNIKLATGTLEAIDAYATRKSRELGMDVNRTDAVRMLIAKGLKE